MGVRFSISGVARLAGRYATAALTVGAGLWLRLLLQEMAGGELPTYITFYPAVMLTAATVGVGPGLAATVLSGLLAGYWILPPVGQFKAESPADLVGFSLFSLMGVLISVGAGLYNRAQRRAADYRADLALQQRLAKVAADNERALRESRDEVQRQRQWLRVTLTSIGDGVVACDVAGHVTFINPVAVVLTGWTSKEALGQPLQGVFRIVNEQSGKPAEDIVATVLREGRAVTIANNTCLIAKDGRQIPIEDSAAPILGATGEVEGVVLVFHDVTDKRRAQEVLRESERRVRLKLQSILAPEGEIAKLELADILDVPAVQLLVDRLQEIVPVPMAILDLQGRVLVGAGWQDICTRFHRIHPRTCVHCRESDTLLAANVPAGEFRLYKCKNSMWDMATPIMVGGQHMGNLYIGQFFFDDDVVDREAFRAQAREYAFAEEEYLAALDRVPRLGRDIVYGSIAYYIRLAEMLSQVSYSNLKLARSLAQLDSLMKSLRESEGRFRRLVELAPIPVCVMKADGAVDYLNERFTRVFGYTSGEIGTVADWWPRAYPDEGYRRWVIENWEAALARATNEGCDIEPCEYNVTCKDGEVRLVEIAGIRIEDSVLTTFVDVTDRRRAEEAMRDAKLAAEAANQAKSEFLANMSHEIRTPMTAVMGFAELLANIECSPEEQREYLDTILQSGKGLLQLIDDILDLSKIEAGKLTIDAVQCSPRQVIEEVLSLMQVRARQKHLLLDATYVWPLPAVICTDPTRLRQILVNLVGNAIKFTQEGEVRITTTFAETSSGPRLHFAVSDTGVGIRDEHLTQIFAPFSQADASSTRRFGGTGLGLTISRRLARMLGGDIAVESHPGEGSVFTLTVDPGSIARMSMVSEDSPVAGPPSESQQPSLRLAGRVLLMEDTPANQRLVQTLLARAGLEIDLAEDGQQGCRMALASAADGRPYDLILMDVQMPHVDGNEAARRLRENGWKGPLVAVTAHAMTGDRETCLEAGFDDYLAKPIHAQQLLQTVERHLPSHSPP